MSSHLNTRRAATILLLLVTITFLSTILFKLESGAWLWVRAFSEAAMVGALADWFAVSALFRHPLGIPIPHTAIIPNNRERIANTLADFVCENFLSQQVLLQKLETAGLVDRFAQWLAEEHNRNQLAERLHRLLPDLLEFYQRQDLRQKSASVLVQLLSNKQIVLTLADLLEQLVVADRAELLVSELVDGANIILSKHSNFIRESVRSEMPWYVPRFVHDKVYRDLVAGFERKLAQIKADSNHPARAKLIGELKDFCVKLKSDQALQAKLAAAIRSFLAPIANSNYLQQLWQQFVLLSSEQGVKHYISSLLACVSQVFTAVAKDQLILDQLNSLFSKSISAIPAMVHPQLHSLICSVVLEWETQTLIEKVELEIGQDLQFIRINGTLVGGIIGVTLEVLRQLLS